MSPTPAATEPPRSRTRARANPGRTLVISDLHLGSRSGRDALERPEVLAKLLEETGRADRLVLLGDTVELLMGTPERSMARAAAVLEQVGRAVGRDGEVVIVAGNHDHALVRPWLRARLAERKPIGLASTVGIRSSEGLRMLAAALKRGGAGSVKARYPGVWLSPRTWAHHGHYLDRHLVRNEAMPRPYALPEDYERAFGVSLAALGAVMATMLPGPLGEPVERVANQLRSAGASAVPLLANAPGASALAPLSAGVLGLQFRRAGLPAMAEVTRRLQVGADHVVFGHLHRGGPRPGDDADEWRPGGAPRLWNTGCWVYEPLLLAGSKPPHPYWPGGAIVVEGDGPPQSVSLLDDVPAKLLR